jgi:hypothetical protein
VLGAVQRLAAWAAWGELVTLAEFSRRLTAATTDSASARVAADQGACHSAHARGGGRGGWAVNAVLIVPWDPALGEPCGPAELPGFGLIDEDDTMDLLTAAGQNPATRWCLTMTGRDGTAAAHGCIPGRRTLAGISSRAGAGSLDLAAPGVRKSCRSM